MGTSEAYPQVSSETAEGEAIPQPGAFSGVDWGLAPGLSTSLKALESRPSEASPLLGNNNNKIIAAVVTSSYYEQTLH